MKHLNVRLVTKELFQTFKHFDNFTEKCKVLNIPASYRQLRKLRKFKGLVCTKTG